VTGGGANEQTATLLPGESATLETVFAAPGQVTLFCPVAGGAHRQQGMETALAVGPVPAGVAPAPTPAPRPAPTAPALTGPAAGDDRVQVPPDYRTRFLPFYVFDRADNRQVRAVYVSPQGALAREGRPFPYGTTLVMETYRAQLNGEEIALDANGRYIRGDLTGVFAMRKEPGFGAKYGPDRTGEWEYVAYHPDMSGFATVPERSQACAQCHLAISDAQKDWVARGNLFFAGRGAAPGLPRTGLWAHGVTSPLPALTPLVAAALAPVLGLAGLALRSLRRRP
jgi:hemoglobin